MLFLVSLAHAADRGPGIQDSPAAMALLAVAGAFPIVAAWRDWDWFFNHRKARLFVAMFGRSGARIFYAFLGFVLGGIALARMVSLL